MLCCCGEAGVSIRYHMLHAPSGSILSHACRRDSPEKSGILTSGLVFPSADLKMPGVHIEVFQKEVAWTKFNGKSNDPPGLGVRQIPTKTRDGNDYPFGDCNLRNWLLDQEL